MKLHYWLDLNKYAIAFVVINLLIFFLHTYPVLVKVNCEAKAQFIYQPGESSEQCIAREVNHPTISHIILGGLTSPVANAIVLCKEALELAASVLGPIANTRL